MMIRYIYGLRGLMSMLALVLGLSCLIAAIVFFVRTPLPNAPIPVAWGLVATCAVVVFIVGLLWGYSLRYWSRAIAMENKYWEHLSKLAAQQLVGPERRERDL